MKYYSLEEFLNDKNINIDWFVDHMDQSQTNYSSLSDYMSKNHPILWILNAFSFSRVPNRHTTDWHGLSHKWENMVSNLEDSTQILFYKREEINREKLKINFE